MVKLKLLILTMVITMVKPPFVLIMIVLQRLIQQQMDPIPFTLTLMKEKRTPSF